MQIGMDAIFITIEVTPAFPLSVSVTVCADPLITYSQLAL